MRYPQGGGLTAERQQLREELRLQAAERFARGEGSSAIAEDLRVSVRSVQRWRRVWAEGGPRALRSQGPMTYTIQGVRKLVVRNGWSCQVPARRAVERDDDTVAGWAREVWPCAED